MLLVAPETTFTKRKDKIVSTTRMYNVTIMVTHYMHELPKT